MRRRDFRLGEIREDSARSRASLANAARRVITPACYYYYCSCYYEAIRAAGVFLPAFPVGPLRKRLEFTRRRTI